MKLAGRARYETFSIALWGKVEIAIPSHGRDTKDQVKLISVAY